MTAPAPAAGDRIPSLAPGIVAEEIEGEILVYDPATVTAVYLNPTAAVILDLCDGTRSQQAIIAVLAESFPDAGPELAGDVAAALDRLHADGVIVYA